MGCTERHIGCHSGCERYLEEKEQREKAKSEILKHKSADKAVADVLWMDCKDKGKTKIKCRIAKRKKY
jgi:hypothetical protein